MYIIPLTQFTQSLKLCITQCLFMFLLLLVSSTSSAQSMQLHHSCFSYTANVFTGRTQHDLREMQTIIPPTQNYLIVAVRQVFNCVRKCLCCYNSTVLYTTNMLCSSHNSVNSCGVQKKLVDSFFIQSTEIYLTGQHQ